MFFIYTGNDTENKNKTLATQVERFSEYELVNIDTNEFSNENLINLSEGQSLFGGNKLFILKSVLEKSENREIALKNKEKLAKSKNIFFFIEDDIKKSDIKPFEKFCEDVKVFNVPAKKEQKFNIFQITDAFSAKDKKNTWVLMQKALIYGVSHAEITNILIWQVKNLILVKGKKGDEADIKKTGLNPFVFKKSLSGAKNWEENSLKEALKNLVFLYHDDRRGESIENTLESFILKTL